MALYEDISSGDEEASQLFITQSSFREPDTQAIDSAADEVGLFDFDLSDVHVLNAQDLAKINDYKFDQKAMCEKIFDFTEGPINNGWTVENATNDGPYTVTRNSDGKQFVVGEGFCEEIPEFKSKEVIPSAKVSQAKVSEDDLKRFDCIVSKRSWIEVEIRGQNVIIYLICGHMFEFIYCMLQLCKFLKLISDTRSSPRTKLTGLLLHTTGGKMLGIIRLKKDYYHTTALYPIPKIYLIWANLRSRKFSAILFMRCAIGMENVTTVIPYTIWSP